MLQSIILDIKKNIFHSKFKITILCLTQIIAMLCVLIAYGIASNLFISKIEQTTLNTTYFIDLRHLSDLSNPNSEIVGKINYSNFKSKITPVLQASDNWKSLSVYGKVLYNGKELSFVGINPNLSIEYVASENGFTKDDYIYDNRIISINQEAISKNNGDIIKIGGKEYTVKAAKTKTFAADIVIPYNSMTDDFIVSRFDLFLNEIPTQNEVNAVAGAISDNFGTEIDIVTPEIPDLIEHQFNDSSALITLLIAIIILVNFGFLYNYILITQSNVIQIYKITGSTKGNLISAFMTEFEIISIAMFPFSLTIFFKILCPYLAKYYDVFSTAFTVQTTIAILICYLTIDIVVKLIEIIPCINGIYSAGKEDIQ